MNKYLITLIVPKIEQEYNIYIPNNKKIGTIKEKVLQTINELSNGNYNRLPDEVQFIDKNTGLEYPNDLMVKDSNIKNSTKIIVI